jgi:hypothetical protein
MRLTGTAAVGDGADTPTADAAPPAPVVASLEEATTPAEVMDYLCRGGRATYAIERPEGKVRVRLTYHEGPLEGDTIAGVGDTTKAAVAALVARLTNIGGAL